MTEWDDLNPAAQRAAVEQLRAERDRLLAEIAKLRPVLDPTALEAKAILQSLPRDPKVGAHRRVLADLDKPTNRCAECGKPTNRPTRCSQACIIAAAARRAADLADEVAHLIGSDSPEGIARRLGHPSSDRLRDTLRRHGYHDLAARLLKAAA